MELLLAVMANLRLYCGLVEESLLLPHYLQTINRACLKECYDRDWRVSCIPRDYNSRTDSLAKRGILRSQDMFLCYSLERLQFGFGFVVAHVVIRNGSNWNFSILPRDRNSLLDSSTKKGVYCDCG
ncbi:hypothetical protein V6N13_024936 [Hibiscus sabdariffa]